MFDKPTDIDIKVLTIICILIYYSIIKEDIVAKIIAVANQKGGVGKTTTTVNLSAVLAEKGYRVMLIDSDPQGNATSSLGVTKKVEKSLYDALIDDDVDIKDTLKKTAIPTLDLCPSNINLAGAEVELVSMMSREQRLKNQLDKVQDDYDYIFIDCPPSLGLITLNALTAANSVLIPIQCEYFALEGLSQLTNTINLVKKHLNKDLKVEGAVLTMYHSVTNLSNSVVKEVQNYFKDNVFKTVIPRNVKVSEAPSFGMSIIEYDPKSSGAGAYVKLGDEILERNKDNTQKI